MMESHPNISEGLAERLSAGASLLQTAFRSLPRSAAPADGAARFVTVLREVLPDASIDLLYCSAPGGTWELQVDGGAGARSLAGSLPVADEPWKIKRIGEVICVVQRMADRSSAGVLLARPGGLCDETDVLVLRLFLHLYDAALQEQQYRRIEKELIFSLNQRVLQLNSLIDTGIEVAKLDHQSSPQRLALERAVSLTNASKGVVRVSEGEGVREELFFPSADAVHGVASTASRISSEFAFGGQNFRFELFEKESRKGELPFEQTDQLLLDALARQVHASLENRYLHRQALEKQRFEQDVAVAASIQQRILPASLPVIEGYDLAGVNIPSKSVGGDYYDCIPLPGGLYALVIADVAGKGIPAALLVSSFHAYLSAYLEEGLELVDLAKRLNRAISKASTDDKFITAFIAVLDPAAGTLESVSAGHTPVYLRRADGSVAELTKGGVPFGMLDLDLPYETERIVLGRGDRLLMYTDGIPEAHNPEGDLFDSAAPLKELFQNQGPVGASTFVKTLLDDLRRFTREAPQADDITAMCLFRG